MTQRIVKKSKKQFRFDINVEKFHDFSFFLNQKKELSDISFAAQQPAARAGNLTVSADRLPPTISDTALAERAAEQAGPQGPANLLVAERVPKFIFLGDGQ